MDISVLYMVQRYEALLNFLRSHGGLFGGLKPEFLLDLESFIKFRNATQMRIFLDRDFPKLSIYSWLMLIYQIIKLFTVSRVTLKSFKHLPGITGTKQDWNLPKSNIYSVSEIILLKW